LTVIFKLASSGVDVPISWCAIVELTRYLFISSLQLPWYTECTMVHNLSWILQHIPAASAAATLTNLVIC